MKPFQKILLNMCKVFLKLDLSVGTIELMAQGRSMEELGRSEGVGRKRTQRTVNNISLNNVCRPCSWYILHSMPSSLNMVFIMTVNIKTIKPQSVTLSNVLLTITITHFTSTSTTSITCCLSSSENVFWVTWVMASLTHPPTPTSHSPPPTPTFFPIISAL